MAQKGHYYHLYTRQYTEESMRSAWQAAEA